jgi:hypothetical protein
MGYSQTGKAMMQRSYKAYLEKEIEQYRGLLQMAVNHLEAHCPEASSQVIAAAKAKLEKEF